MINSMKRILAAILYLSIIVSGLCLFPISASAAVESGICGENLTWKYDSSTKTLTVSGKGDMADYSHADYNGERVTTAPWKAYYNTVKNVIIEDGVTSIGEKAFYGCEGLSSVTIGNSVTSIGKSAFSGCRGLASAVMGNSVTSIGGSAFAACRSLSSVTIPDSVKSIGAHAFYGCEGLASAAIGNSVTSIGSYAFYRCGGLTKVTIPDCVTSIGDLAFSCCWSLTGVTIPDAVTSIGDLAFSGCMRLSQINVSGGSSAYASEDGVLFSKDKTKLLQYPIGNKRSDYTVPDTVTSIEHWAFSDCMTLASVTIPDSVTAIGYNAFYACRGLASVTIPDSVTSIGNSAFYDCPELSDVYYGGTKEKWNKISIESENDCLTAATIHFKDASELPVTPGDIDSDGNVNIKDSATLKLAILGKRTLTDAAMAAADINSDGIINLKDSFLLRQIIMGVNI